MRFLAILLALFLFSCGGSEMEKELSNADSVLITFYDETGGKTTETAVRSAVRTLARFIAGKEGNDMNCQADGTVVFVRGTENTRVEFFLDEACRYFAIDHGGSLQFTNMSNEAHNFLQALKAGRNYY